MNEDRLERLEALVVSLYTNFLVVFDKMNGAKSSVSDKNLLESMKEDKEIITQIVLERRLNNDTRN